jgi:hypothetical protein
MDGIRDIWLESMLSIDNEISPFFLALSPKKIND